MEYYIKLNGITITTYQIDVPASDTDTANTVIIHNYSVLVNDLRIVGWSVLQYSIIKKSN